MEFIHDELVPLHMAFDEPVNKREFRDLNLLDAAVNRPFQTFGGDLYPTIFEKAAALVPSVVCNHCFYNGNKRTAVIALDMFLTANEMILLLSNDDMYGLAKATASGTANLRSPQQVFDFIVERITAESLSFEDLEKHAGRSANVDNTRKAYNWYRSEASAIRNHPLNIVSN